MHKNRVLIVAYHFPPDSEVGALRPQKFAKYLSEFGWDPYVLTIKEKYIVKRDDSRLLDVQNVPIFRTSFWRTPLQLLIDVRDKLKNRHERNSKHYNPEFDKGPAASQNSETLVSRLKRYFASLNWFPDDKLYWSIPALIAGYRLVREHKIDCIYATAPPHTVAIIGLLLSKLTGVKLVVEFRDPWVLYRQRVPESLRCRLYDALEAYFEKAALEKADKIIVTTERLCSALSSRYPAIQKDKFVSITNGYDNDDIKKANIAERKDRKYIISYVGMFYVDRNPEVFLMALKKAIEDGKIPEDDIEVRFIGVVSAIINKPVNVMLEELGMSRFVTIIGQVPHCEAVSQMIESDLLLLLAHNFRNQIPAKTFEYMAVKRPILALTEDGATADLIRLANAGIVAPQDDLTSVYDAIITLYNHHKNHDKEWYQGFDVTTFERRNLTHDLATILTSLMTSQRATTHCQIS